MRSFDLAIVIDFSDVVAASSSGVACLLSNRLVRFLKILLMPVLFLTSVTG